MSPEINTPTYPYEATDRFDHSRYRLSQATYYQIMDLIKFYHESMYLLPDDEVVIVERLIDQNHTEYCKVSVNHLVLE
ncbi:hypothetical protein [Marinoscillum sp. 108]|uniref:hypothetical protein n=1 Tax=Marinoscillum sp. 108 TaxID=2653151 RepID=UPI0012F0754F|nr:hypothetical protein [Marinoscillum sp. 108]VXD16152.1 hypothetical protein MARINOS108_120047 [Marinoscillum sp. 108]